MIDKIRTFLRNDVDVQELKKQYSDIYSAIESMEKCFSEGGPITWEQLLTYEVSTAENPIGYPTGKNCISFRLQDIGGKMVFFTTCVAPPGEEGSFGWHWHPKTSETNTQLTGTAKHGGKKLPPFSVSVFAPGTPHDYILPPNGSLITVFEKVLE